MAFTAKHTTVVSQPLQAGELKACLRSGCHNKKTSPCCPYDHHATFPPVFQSVPAHAPHHITQETSKAELISVSTDAAANSIIVIWRLEGKVNLPFKPSIKPYVVTTTFGVDSSSGLICSQLGRWALLNVFMHACIGGGCWLLRFICALTNSLRNQTGRNLTTSGLLPVCLPAVIMCCAASPRPLPHHH